LGRNGLLLAAFLAALLGLGLLAYALARPSAVAPPITVFAAGFSNPRGMAFDAAGSLYLAEAGAGGTERVRTADGRETFRVGQSGRVWRLRGDGQREQLGGSLPSIYSERHEDYLGPAAVAVANGQVFVLTCTAWSEAPGYENRILRLQPDGQSTMLLDYSALSLSQPSLARRTDPRADVPAGVPFGMTAFDDRLYTTDGNLEFVQEIGLDGRAGRRLLEYPLSTHVLTGITVGPDRALNLTEMGPWPYPEGSGQVTRLTPSGEASIAAEGLTAPIGVAFGGDAQMYVIEHRAPVQSSPRSGRLVAPRPDGSLRVVREGLNYPTAIVSGPDGNLYIANNGNGSRRAEGEVLRVEIVPQGPLDALQRRLRALGLAGLIGSLVIATALALAAGFRLRESRRRPRQMVDR
jgi:hypothetical protein